MFCGQGLKQTYGIKVGRFVPLDAGGPKTRNALTGGSISIGLVFIVRLRLRLRGRLTLTLRRQRRG